LLCLNLLYLAWNTGWLGTSEPSPDALVRAPGQQAPQNLFLLSEMPEDFFQAELVLLAETTDGPLTEGLGEAEEEESFDLLIPLCSEVGVFTNQLSANEFASNLGVLGHTARVEQELEPASGFRVFMPPFNSEAALSQTLAELQRQGIESFIIRSGELMRGISLGVFSREEAAAAFQEQLAARGYASSIRELPRQNGIIRILIESPVNQVQTEDLWLRVQESNPELNLTEKLCETIAPGV